MSNKDCKNMRKSLLSTNVTAILKNKLFIPLTAWDSLPEEAKSIVAGYYIQKHNNPFKCFVHMTGRKCPRKEALISIGKNPLGACFKCKSSEEKVSCVSKGKDYIKFDTGNKHHMTSVINVFRSNGIELIIEDQTVFPKIGNVWEMDWTKMDKSKSVEQERMAKLWLQHKNGMLVCPPRFGKSLLTAFIAVKAKTRVLILVHKIDLARQFLKDYTTYTTIPKDKISINPNAELMKTNYVSICTYQQFARNEKRFKSVKDTFGLIIVDEVHKAAADKYYEVVTGFNARYRLGVTATPTRRDSKEFRIEHAFGPVLAEGGSEQLSCDYIFVDTNWKCKYQLSSDKGWTALWKQLSIDEDRNLLIAQHAIQDVLDGHRVMIPVKRHTHLETLYKLITLIAKKQGLVINVCQYHGELQPDYRRELQEAIYQGKYDVVIGMDSIISLGFNAPPISALFLNVHTYRSFVPELYQEYSRIRTKCDYIEKKKPLIRIFRDYGHEVVEKSMSVIERELRSKGFTDITNGITNNKSPKQLLFETTEQQSQRSKKGLKKLF